VAEGIVVASASQCGSQTNERRFGRTTRLFTIFAVAEELVCPEPRERNPWRTMAPGKTICERLARTTTAPGGVAKVRPISDLGVEPRPLESKCGLSGLTVLTVAGRSVEFGERTADPSCAM
jgi:hypothetical protein